jgi:hypothetical protein
LQHAGVPVTEPTRGAQRGSDFRIGDVLVENRGQVTRRVLAETAADRAAACRARVEDTRLAPGPAAHQSASEARQVISSTNVV